MKVIVTGATSIIGVPLIKKLLQDDYEVFAVVRPNSMNIIKLESLMVNKNLHLIELDLAKADMLPKYISGECDTCIHLAWDGAGSENRKKREIQQKNVTTSMSMLKACMSLNCKRFIFSGSQAEYGPCSNLIDESTLCEPVSEYGKAKVDFMNLAKEYLQVQSHNRMQYIHTRIFSIYGPEDHKGSLVDACVSAFFDEQEVRLGKCEHLWNYLYIDDLINAYIMLINMRDNENQFLVYNIAGRKEETRPLKEYVELIYDSCGRQGKYVLAARQENAEGAANLIPDIRKIEEEVGWYPLVTFEEGIHRIVSQRRKEYVQE